MSLYGALFSSVSGLNAQGTAMAVISDNISNLNTVGYKGSKADFSTLVSSSNQSGGVGSYSSGGVSAAVKQDIMSGGLQQATNSITDLAINGNGFFAVNSQVDQSGNYYYTRAGSFDKDPLGNLVNKSGNYLLAWPLDSNGKLPGQAGNLNTTSNSLIESLNVVNISSISGNASQTTNVSLGINLKASDAIIQGSGGMFEFPTTSVNSGNAANTLIVPDAGSNIVLNIGDVISLNPSDPGQTYNFEYGGMSVSNQLSGVSTLGANTSSDVFAANTGDSFTITTVVAGQSRTYTYNFEQTSPTPSQNQFNNLDSLAASISLSPGLTARVNNGKLYVANTNANNLVTFASPVTSTTNFVSGLGLTNVTAATNSQNRFATLQDLANKISLQSGMTAIVSNPLNASSVTFYASDPLGSLNVSATGQSTGTTTGLASTTNSILTQFGLNGAQSYIAAYNPTDASRNFSGGNVKSEYSTNVRLYDALGTGHDFQVSFGKISEEEWAVEIYALNVGEIVSSRTDGQVASGTLTFNGDGTLRSVSSSLALPVNIAWSDHAVQSAVTFNWGSAGQIQGTVGATSIGKADGVSQFDSPYSQTFINQNGISAGLLSNVQIDSNGYIVAQFSNGTSRKIYQIPLVSFTSPNKLQAEVGNVYSQTNASGTFNLNVPNTGSVGQISSQTLEGANVELSDQLTNMIIAQRGYEANAKAIKVANEMLLSLTQLF